MWIAQPHSLQEGLWSFWLHHSNHHHTLTQMCNNYYFFCLKTKNFGRGVVITFVFLPLLERSLRPSFAMKLSAVRKSPQRFWPHHCNHYNNFCLPFCNFDSTVVGGMVIMWHAKWARIGLPCMVLSLFNNSGSTWACSSMARITKKPRKPESHQQKQSRTSS